MAYEKDTKLIMTIQPTTMGDDAAGSIGTAIGSIVNALRGSSTSTTTSQADLQAAMAAQQGGIGTGTLLMLGALGVGGYFVYKKMKKKRR